jgi:hypothetical protein
VVIEKEINNLPSRLAWILLRLRACRVRFSIRLERRSKRLQVNGETRIDIDPDQDSPKRLATIANEISSRILEDIGTASLRS